MDARTGYKVRRSEKAVKMGKPVKEKHVKKSASSSNPGECWLRRTGGGAISVGLS